MFKNTVCQQQLGITDSATQLFVGASKLFSYHYRSAGVLILLWLLVTLTSVLHG
jgi:hypothetical protein